MGSALGVTSCEIQTSKYFYSASLLEYELYCNLYLYLYHFLFCICTYSAREDNAADCIGNGTYLPQCPLGAPCKAAAHREYSHSHRRTFFCIQEFRANRSGGIFPVERLGLLVKMGRPWPGTQGTANIHPRCEAPTHICTRLWSKVWPEGMVMPQRLHIPGSGWRCRGAYQRSKQRPKPGSEERTTEIGSKSMVVENQTLASSYSSVVWVKQETRDY